MGKGQREGGNKVGETGKGQRGGEKNRQEEGLISQVDVMKCLGGHMECLGGMRLHSFLILLTHATPGTSASLNY